ncbi:transcriptional regulator AfsR [Streptomyces thermolineatus]|uniref:Transcriptional regulator AfsR n=1 Tax=Streptomyces thermolineatus TaxID=44033 RepID=A0ABN3MQ51_9ACTN
MNDGSASDLRFALLGPVRVWDGENPLNAGSPQQRAMLAVLLLRRGRTATAPELIDAMWGEEPPSQATATLRTYASRLRKVLGASALVTEAGGYALRVAPGALDLARAEMLAAEAEKRRAAGDPRRSRELLAEALGLWDGEALAGTPGPYMEGQRSRLTEWRLALLESRLELDLELGGHTEAVSELTALSAEYPLRERLRSLLMLALYRGGRQAEALGLYADTRRLLADELGVDPGPELAELHQRILRADPALAAQEAPAAEAPEGGGPAWVRPAQLPATVADFTGRAAFVAELGQQLSTAGGRVMAVSALAGIGGVGKTTLAVHVAHEASEHFPDGQLYVDLQGSSPRPAEPEVVLASFLRALGTPDSAVPDSLEDRAALFRSALAGRRVLTVLDNARDAAQIRPLLPGAAGCAVLVTSRVRMVDLAGAHLVDLDVMSPEEALDLFTRIVGEERVDSEREAALDVVGACGFLPLAIRIAASRLATRRTWTVSFLARKLADGKRRLDELRVGDLAVAATFELGYGQLEPHQARAFRLLSLPDGPDISLPAAAAVLDMDPDDAEDLLESLVDASLLESAAPGRYRYHDLVRLYARSRAESDDPPGTAPAALARLLDFCLATAARAYELERPGDRAPHHLTAVSRPGLPLDCRDSALDWLFAEAPGLLAAARQAAAPENRAMLRPAADLLLMAQDLMESGIHARAYEDVTRAVVEAAHAAGDRLVEGRARSLLGQALGMSGQFDGADAEARYAMTLGTAVTDPVTCSYAPNLRGIIALYRSRYQEAADYFDRALSAFRDDGNEPGEAAALSNLSRALLSLGQKDRAVAAAEAGVAIYQRQGVTLRLGNGLYALGIALAEAGRLEEAVDRQSEALAIFRANRQRLWEGMTFYRLAHSQLAAGRPRQAAAHAEQALKLLRDIGGDWRRGTVQVILGRALRAVGQHDRARACWTEALELLERTSAPEIGEVRRLLESTASVRNPPTSGPTCASSGRS